MPSLRATLAEALDDRLSFTICSISLRVNRCRRQVRHSFGRRVSVFPWGYPSISPSELTLNLSRLRVTGFAQGGEGFRGEEI
jgi:hypothetical protein